MATIISRTNTTIAASEGLPAAIKIAKIMIKTNKAPNSTVPEIMEIIREYAIWYKNVVLNMSKTLSIKAAEFMGK